MIVPGPGHDTRKRTAMTTTPLEIRAAALDNLKLAEELSRHAAVSARHLSYSEFWQGRDDAAARGWASSADRAEDAYLAELAEVERRLLGDDPIDRSELPRYLALYGVTSHVDELALEVALGRACGQHDRPLPCLECL